MLYVHPFKTFTIFLLFLMFSLIISLVYHTIGLIVMSQLLFGNAFGSLEQLAVDI